MRLNMGDYLVLEYLENDAYNIKAEIGYNTPFARSDVFNATIVNYKKLTRGDDIKEAYELKLSLKDNIIQFEPGDTIGILPENNKDEVEKILIRLGLENLADTPYSLGISPHPKKKILTIPKHIPQRSTLRNIFVHNLCIRGVPKKLFLKSLQKFVSDEGDSNTLEHFCSPKGSQDYSRFISGKGRTLLGLLNYFPSCFPPITVLLEHLPALLPRSYSISSSPLRDLYSIDITFNVIEKNNFKVKGICTGYLEQCIEQFENGKSENVSIYFRNQNSFHLPDNSVPIILIATGTGIGPFKGFLEHRYLQHKNLNYKLSEAYLFYGCRYPDRDYLFKCEIDKFQENGVLTRVFTAYSRETENKVYVQQKLKEQGQMVVDLILKQGASIFICGNGSSMMTDVRRVMIENFVEFGNFSEGEAIEFLDYMQKNNKYLTDMWL